jgi:hypothetical protein
LLGISEDENYSIDGLIILSCTISQEHFMASTKNKYKDNIYLVILALGFALLGVSFVVPNGSVWQSTIISIAANLITLAVFSFFIIEKLLDNQSQRERAIALQDIEVFLLNTDTHELFLLEFALKRGELSRGEIVGRIGMVLKDTTTRYNIEYMKKVDFLEQINQILADDQRQKLIIDCSTEEMSQFKPLKAIGQHDSKQKSIHSSKG